MNARPLFHTAPQVLLSETKPCACCSAEIDCGEYGDDRSGFDPLILHDDGALVCHECVPSWIEDQAPLHDRAYEGGRAVWG